MIKELENLARVMIWLRFGLVNSSHMLLHRSLSNEIIFTNWDFPWLKVVWGQHNVIFGDIFGKFRNHIRNNHEPESKT